MTKTISTQNGLPILGSVLDFANGGPNFLVNMVAQHGEIANFRVFHHSIYLVSSPELIREILVTKSKQFPKSDRDVAIFLPLLGQGLVSTNGTQHKRQRKLTQPAFHARRIGNYAETMVHYTQRLTADWKNGQSIEMSEEMMALTMFIVCKTLFDADWETMEDVAAQAGEAVAVLQDVADASFTLPFQLPQWIPTRNNRRTKAARAVLDGTIDQIMRDRRAASHDGKIEDTGDLLSMLLMAEYDDNSMMDDDEIRDQLVTLFSAGHETTSNALTWTWYLLSQNPEVEAKMHHEIDTVLEGRLPTLADLPQLSYTEMVLKESMRVYPPVWTINARQASEDTAVGEYLLPKGAQVMISPFVMHRLRDYFPEPERFDPERFRPENEEKLPKYAYMPFGGGPRVCIGNTFAMMEAHLILATMAQRFRFELDPDQEIELNTQITMSSTHGMRMKVFERTPTVHLGQNQAYNNNDLPGSSTSESASIEPSRDVNHEQELVIA
ncbi:MAG: cytochrome P450 [Chloroflexota bacterium]